MSNNLNPAEIQWDDSQSVAQTKQIKPDEIQWDEPKQTSAQLPVVHDKSLDKKPVQTKESWWDKAKKGAKEYWDVFSTAYSAVTYNPLIDMVDKATADNEVRKKVEALPAKLFHPDDDIDFDTYQKIGLLAKTAQGLTKASKEDIDTYNKNLGHLLVDKLGYEDFGIDERGKYYVTKDGKDIELGKSDFKTILADILGDSGEIAGGLAGAKKGYDIGKALGWKGKVAGPIIGGAMGAYLGNTADQFRSIIETGEELTAAQRIKEAGKAAGLDLVGNAAGAVAVKGAVAVAKPFVKAYKLATGKKLSERAAEVFAKSASDLPEKEQQDVLDALIYAQDSGIDLTSTSVVQNPQVDQFIQVSARNPFVRKAIKSTEAKNRDKLIKKIFSIIEEKGAKATPEELDKVLKQELGEAKQIRRAETDAAYDAFRASDTGAYKAKKDGLLKDLDERAKEWGYREKDPDSGELINPDLDKQVNRIKRYINYYSKDDGFLSASDLDQINSKLYKMMDSAKDPATRKMLGETRDQIFDHIQVLAEKTGDEVAQNLRKAKALYKTKENIYGINSKHPDIKKALESHQANEELHTLLTGSNALDNANILKQELSRTKHGKELLGALGRKHIDDALKDVDLSSPSAIAKSLSGDKIEVAKRLLGEKAGKDLENIQKLLSMMGKTETLLKGTGAPINNGSHKSLFEEVWQLVKKYTYYYGQHRYMSGVLTSNTAQKAFTKALKTALDAQTKADVKSVRSLLNTSAKAAAKKLNVNMDDIIDVQALKKEEVRQRRLAALEAKKKAGEKVRQTEMLKAQVQNFTTPPAEEIKAVETLYRGDTKYRNFSQTLVRIQDGTATENDIRKYLVAKDKIDADALAKEQQRFVQERAEALERKELADLMGKKDLSDKEIDRLNELDQKYNKPLFAGGAVAGAAGYAQKEKQTDDSGGAGNPGVYVERKVKNNKQVHDWAKEQGFNPVDAKEMHTTIVYSKNNIRIDPQTHKVVIPKEQIIGIKKLGDKGAIVLTLKSDDLNKRWEQTQKDGATWDYDSYQPHITISYDDFKGDLKDVKLPDFDIELKGESVSQIGENKNTISYVGEKEITMDNNAILRDGKLTNDELVALIKASPDYKKQLESFGDVKSEGEEKVLNRMLSVFNGEDPVTALAIVGENFYGGDDKAFARAIQDNKIANISDEWVKSMIEKEPKAETPYTDVYFKPTPNPSREVFVDEVSRAVGPIAEKYNIPKEFILAQIIQETGWGKHILPGTNNIFNIKSHGKEGGSTHKVWEVTDGKKVWVDDSFRRYDTYLDAVEDWVKFLHENPRYKNLWNKPLSAEAFAEEIAKAGYATDPKYAEKIKAIMRGKTFKKLVKS